jgi:hypothetical protein
LCDIEKKNPVGGVWEEVVKTGEYILKLDNAGISKTVQFFNHMLGRLVRVPP